MPSLHEYRQMLRVNKHRLDDELEIQSQIQGDISDKKVIANSRMLEAKDELATIEAQIFAREKEADPKMSNEAIGRTIQLDSKRTRAWQAYQKARSEHEAWQDLYEAWRDRGFSMKSLGELFQSQYFAINSVQNRSRQDRIDTEARASMRQSRDERAAATAERSAEEAGVSVRRRRLSDDN